MYTGKPFGSWVLFMGIMSEHEDMVAFKKCHLQNTMVEQLAVRLSIAQYPYEIQGLT